MEWKENTDKIPQNDNLGKIYTFESCYPSVRVFRMNVARNLHYG